MKCYRARRPFGSARLPALVTPRANITSADATQRNRNDFKRLNRGRLSLTRPISRFARRSEPIHPTRRRLHSCRAVPCQA
jgi:hypothetical protein